LKPKQPLLALEYRIRQIWPESLPCQTATAQTEDSLELSSPARGALEMVKLAEQWEEEKSCFALISKLTLGQNEIDEPTEPWI
jgi:hypothetical protein